jgi:hypothetical protein
VRSSSARSIRFRARATSVLAVGLGALLLASVAVQSVVAVWRPGLFAAGHDVPNAVIGVLGDGVGEILVGTVLASRRPNNPIGWLLLGFGACTALITGGAAIAQAGYDTGHPSLLAQSSLVVSNLAAEGILVTIVLVVALFPSGRVETRGRRYLLGGFWFALAVFTVPLVLAPRLTAGSGQTYPNPLGVSGVGFVTAVGDGGVPLLFLLFLLVFAVDAIRRWLRARGVERQQMKVFGYAMGGWVVVLLCGSRIPANSAWNSVDWTVGSNLVAVAIGVAVLRYRLYEVDRVVSRTVSYAAVTGILVGVYVVMVTLTTRVLPVSSAFAVAASTLVAAAAFNPLRRRVQRGVDRRFNRARYSAEATVAAFAEQLRASVDLDTFRQDLVSVVHTALEPEHASLWLVHTPESVSDRRQL